MRNAWLIVFVSFVMGPRLAVAQTDHRTEVESAMRQFGEAWARHDLPALEGLLGPEYIHTDVNGAVYTRASWLEYVRALAQTGANNKVSFSDVQIHVTGDLAWVTGGNELKGPAFANEPGGTGTRRLRFTQIWVKHDGRWQRAAFQATWIPDTPSNP